MNAQYLQVFAAFLLAQLLMMSIMVYNYQKEKNVDYIPSVKAYVRAEVGYFIIGIFGILVILFIMSDWVNLSVTKEDLLKVEKRSLKQNMQIYFKTTAIVVGAFIQYLAFTFKNKGKAAIDKIADKV